MAELELLQKIAQDISHLRSDVEEIRDLVYPSEDRIKTEFIESVKKAEQEPRKQVKACEARKYLENL
ncbi:MAG: hypothetical protein AABX47_06245 [Nanoarchaeota archaeon]